MPNWKLSLCAFIAPSVFAAPLPPMITGVTQVVNKQALEVRWTDTNTAKVNFKIERAEVASGEVKEVGLRGNDATSMEDYNVKVGKTYAYRIRAVDVKTREISAYSNVYSGALAGPPKPPSPLPPPVPPVPPSGPLGDAAALKTALATAKPGDVIILKPGVYKGKFVLTVSGTAEKPITLTGPRDAVLDGENYKSGYVLHLNGVSHWRIRGITVTNGQKGIMTDGASYNQIEDVAVYGVGMEAVHFRRNSTHNVLADSAVYDTGLAKPDYGECVYIGTAGSNAQDHSDYNSILRNKLGPNCRAEPIDVKELTSFGLIEGNHVDGTGETGKHYAVSGIFIKGSDYLIRGNTVHHAFEEAYRVNVVSKGWGNRNTFEGNTARDVPGFGFNIVKGEGNVVRCDNKVERAGLGFSNVKCAP